jgi:hypothetical protein
MKMKTTSKLWLGILALIVLSPLGLILPERFKAGAAWGEWGAEEVGQLVGYVPQKLQKLSSLWNAPLPDYAFKGWEEKGIMHLNIAYIVSAVAGIALVVAVTLLLGKIMIKQDNGKEK